MVHGAVRSLGLPLKASFIYNETEVYSFSCKYTADCIRKYIFSYFPLRSSDTKA